jgi:hypothetical protein
MSTIDNFILEKKYKNYELYFIYNNLFILLINHSISITKKVIDIILMRKRGRDSIIKDLIAKRDFYFNLKESEMLNKKNLA